MERAFITGAAGFVGSHLTRHLLSNGFEVHVAVQAEAQMTRLESVRDSLHIHPLDITDAEAVRRVVQTVKPDHIFHLAASLVASGVVSSSQDVVDVNILGTKNLLEAARDIPLKSCIVTGSFLEYGPKNRPLSEDDRCEPIEIYGVSKLGATLLSQGMATIHALPTVVFRLFTPYGPEMQKGRLVRELIARALTGEPLLLTKKDIARDFIYVDDVCRLLIEASQRAGELRGEVFNVGSGEATTLEALVELIQKKTSSKSAAQWGALPTVPYDAELCQADMQKTFSRFSWRPQIALSEGLERVAASLKNS